MADRRVRIIDNRSKEKYMMDDAYLNGYARLCGWKATLVYMSLCRHASKDQYCFPSIVLLSQEHAVSRDTVIDGLKILEAWNIIEVGKERKNNGTWLNNSYVLLDKSVWKPKPHAAQVDHSDVDIQVDNSLQSSRPQRLNQVDHSDTKETHREGNTYKETHTSSEPSSADVNPFIELFSLVNPSYATLFPRKPQRAAADRLLKLHDLDYWKRFIAAYQIVLEERFCSKAITPVQLEEKLGPIEAYGRQRKNDKNKEFKVAF